METKINNVCKESEISKSLEFRNFRKFFETKCVWKFRVLYQEHMSIEDVARDGSSCSWYRKRISSGNIWSARKCFSLKFRIFMRSAWVSKRWYDKTARRAVLLIDRFFEKNFKRDYLSSQKVFRAEIFDFISGKHEVWRSGIMPNP